MAQPMQDSKAAAQEDEEIQRKRLLLQTSKFKTVSTTLSKLCKEVERGMGSQSEVFLKAFYKDIMTLEYWSSKQDAIKAANKRDQESYMKKKTEQEVSIIQACQDIEQQKAELAEARNIRQNKEEYEKLRHLIMQLPSRASSVLENQHLEADILRLQAESAALDLAADLRRKQAAVLLHTIDDLQSTFGEAEDDVEAPADNDVTAVTDEETEQLQPVGCQAVNSANDVSLMELG